MGEPEQRERAKHFSDQVKAKLDNEFGSNIHWEGGAPPTLKFTINSKELVLEYKNGDDFVLYDKDAKAQRNEMLGEYSSANITTPDDPTPDQIVAKVKEYTS